MTGLLRGVGDWSPSQRGLRLVVLLAPVAALLAAAPAGDAAPAWFVVVVLAGSGLFAAMPESGWGLAVLVAVVGWWCLVPDDGLGVAVVPAAVALLAAHVAALLASYGPGEAGIERALLARWVVRGGLALLAAPAAWLVAVVARGTVAPSGLWAAGMLAALLALLVGSVAISDEDA